MFNLYLIIENYLETCILKRILITRDKKMKKRTKLLTSTQYGLNLQVLMQYPMGTCKEEYETLAS